MDILFLLIPLSVVLILAAVAIFLWMFDNEQFDDLDGQAYKILTDDDTSEPSALDAKTHEHCCQISLKNPGSSRNTNHRRNLNVIAWPAQRLLTTNKSMKTATPLDLRKERLNPSSKS